MESDAILQMHKRSVEKYQVQFNAFIGDENISKYIMIDKRQGIYIALPSYGAIYLIEKECVNHITKRMRSNLRLLKWLKQVSNPQPLSL